MRNLEKKLKQEFNQIDFDKEITSAVVAERTGGHAANEMNCDKSNQKMVAEHLATEQLMAGTKIMIEKANLYRKSFNVMLATQIELVDNAKILTQKSKDYTNQMGEAMARIDKVLVRDFEAKLLLLERFVAASKEMAELEKSGILAKISSSLARN